jgi:UDP-2,3-diacylglucosamine pyrophosphatase LpxH
MNSSVPAATGVSPKVFFRTLVLSDLHLGTKDAQARALLEVLRGVRCEKLILNGDIIDLWSLQRKNYWSPAHTAVVRRIMKMAEKDGTKVIYLRGNHDDFIRRLIPITFDQIELAEEHVHTDLQGRRYLCIHGDAFDTVTAKMRWLAVLGDVSYQILLDVNRVYNRWRAWRGKEYFSLSQAIKGKVKSAVNFISSFEEHLQTLASRRSCDGVMCGHIHKAEDRMMGSIRYLNSGDWVESLTAIVEETDGQLRVVDHVELRRRIAAQRAQYEASQVAPVLTSRANAEPVLV